jgi:2,3-diketo-5-methylthiopentyl-1-phosphate enolase
MIDPLIQITPESCDPDKYILATYLITAPAKSAHEVMQAIALEQSTGTWTGVPEETEAVRIQSVAKIPAIYEVPHYEDRLPEPGAPRTFIAQVAFPAENINNQFPQMLTAVYGNISMSGKLKVLDIRFPRAFVESMPGPAFGIAGLRKAAGVEPGRPMLCAMFKPCVGAPPKSLAKMLYELGLGGVNVVKDDELLASPPFCTIEARLEQVLKAVAQVKKETGRTVLYALNVTDAPEPQARNIEMALKMGANCLMFNVPTIGWSSFAEAVRQIKGRVPVLAHPDFAGAYHGSPEYGLNSALVLGKFSRMAGADMQVCPSAYGKVPMVHDRVLSIAQYLRAPLYDVKGCMPAPSAGMIPGQVQQLLNDFGPDTMVAGGGGYHGHPQGATAGARAFTQAVDAWVAKVPLDVAARDHEELRLALQKWGVFTWSTPTQYALTSA